MSRIIKNDYNWCDMEMMASRFNPARMLTQDDLQLSNHTGIIVVFATPQEIIDLDIGLDEMDFNGMDVDEMVPMSVDELSMYARASIYGATNHTEVELSVPNSMCAVNFVICINGKYCKLNTNEWNLRDNFHNMRPATQLILYQRLIMEKQVTLNDIAAADVDVSVYKRLCLNEEIGDQMYREKIARIGTWIERQQADPALMKKYYMFMRALDQER